MFPLSLFCQSTTILSKTDGVGVPKLLQRVGIWPFVGVERAQARMVRNCRCHCWPFLVQAVIAIAILLNVPDENWRSQDGNWVTRSKWRRVHTC